MLKVAIVGQPNTGKTTLYNFLTSSNSHTGNFDGVTVDIESKRVFFKDEDMLFFDLPGIFSFNPITLEEKISIEFINKNNDIYYVCVVDAMNIERNLYLAMCLKEQNIPFVLFINHKERFKKNGGKLNIKALSYFFETEIIFSDCYNFANIELLLKKINIVKECEKKVLHIQNNNENNNIDKKNINIDLEKNLKFKEKKIDSLNAKKKIIDCKKKYERAIDLKNIEIKNSLQRFDKKNNISSVDDKYNYIEKICLRCLSIQKKTRISIIDKIILNKFLFFPIFLLSSFFVLYFIFWVVGPIFSENLLYILKFCIFDNIFAILQKINISSVLLDLIINGIINPISSVLIFLVPISLLSLSLKFFEDSGIFSRLAFMLDDVMQYFGLNGKAVYTLLMGYGCNTSAVVLTKNLPDKNMQKRCAIALPFITCSAKLPIYTIIATSLLGKEGIVVIFGIYLLSIFISLLVSLVLQRFLPSESQVFFIDFPEVYFPKILPIILAGLASAKDFMVKIFSTIIGASIIIWFLLNFDFSLTYNPNYTENILYISLSKISAIFSPIGLNNPNILVSLIVGILAKELVLSTISLLGGIGGLSVASMVSLLVFVCLYIPCVSTLKAVKSIVGKGYILFAIVLHLLIAYFISFVVYQLFLGNLFSYFIIFISFIFVFLFIKNSFRKKLKYSCKNCKGCNY